MKSSKINKVHEISKIDKKNQVKSTKSRVYKTKYLGIIFYFSSIYILGEPRQNYLFFLIVY